MCYQAYRLEMFFNFEVVASGVSLYISDSSKVKDKRNIIMKTTSGKELTMKNVFYVTNICRNKFVLTKNGFYVD